MNTRDKIRSFAELKKGWFYSTEGQPFSEKALLDSCEVAEAIEAQGFDSGAFPGLDGDVLMTASRLPLYWEFRRVATDDWTLAFEIDYEERVYLEHQTKVEVLAYIATEMKREPMNLK